MGTLVWNGEMAACWTNWEGFRALRVHGLEVLVQNELSMRDEK